MEMNMYIVDRTARFVRGFLLSYGPSNIKKRFWDKEYSEEKWSFAYNTVGDCVYPPGTAYRERKHSGYRMRIRQYRDRNGRYISQLSRSGYIRSSLGQARRRSQECGRGEKNSFECGDFLTYVPTGQYDVILFRESMYHVPLGKVKETLDRYSAYLKDGGVFVVRLFASSGERTEDKSRPTAMLKIMEAEFDVVEKGRYEVPGKPTVIVFRPKVLVKN
jgi:hypothetical protein